MAYDEKVVRAAKQRLEKRRRDAETSAAALRERMCGEIPRLREIEREKAAAIPELTHAILSGNADGAVERIRQKNLALPGGPVCLRVPVL